jgi:hypothetical protein
VLLKKSHNVLDWTGWNLPAISDKIGGFLGLFDGVTDIEHDLRDGLEGGKHHARLD